MCYRDRNDMEKLRRLQERHTVKHNLGVSVEEEEEGNPLDDYFSSEDDEDWEQAIVQAVDQSGSGRGRKRNVGLRTMDEDSRRKRASFPSTTKTSCVVPGPL